SGAASRTWLRAADGGLRHPRRRRARRARGVGSRRAGVDREVPGRPRGGRSRCRASSDPRARRPRLADRRQARRSRTILLTWNQVRARRLARSSLTGRSTELVEVVRQIGGIHAQVQASAELQLAVRVDGVTQQDVRDALWRDRTLVKTWALRGTLHLHPADELPLWFAARRALRNDSDEGFEAWPDPQGVVHPPVSAAELGEIRAAVWGAFDGRALLREELAAEVIRSVGRKHEGR